MFYFLAYFSIKASFNSDFTYNIIYNSIPLTYTTEHSKEYITCKIICLFFKYNDKV